MVLMFMLVIYLEGVKKKSLTPTSAYNSSTDFYHELHGSSKSKKVEKLPHIALTTNGNCTCRFRCGENWGHFAKPCTSLDSARRMMRIQPAYAPYSQSQQLVVTAALSTLRLTQENCQANNSEKNLFFSHVFFSCISLLQQHTCILFPSKISFNLWIQGLDLRWFY